MEFGLSSINEHSALPPYDLLPQLIARTISEGVASYLQKKGATGQKPGWKLDPVKSIKLEASH